MTHGPEASANNCLIVNMSAKFMYVRPPSLEFSAYDCLTIPIGKDLSHACQICANNAKAANKGLACVLPVSRVLESLTMLPAPQILARSPSAVR